MCALAISPLLVEEVSSLKEVVVLLARTRLSAAMMPIMMHVGMQGRYEAVGSMSSSWLPAEREERTGKRGA